MHPARKATTVRGSRAARRARRHECRELDRTRPERGPFAAALPFRRTWRVRSAHPTCPGGNRPARRFARRGGNLRAERCILGRIRRVRASHVATPATRTPAFTKGDHRLPAVREERWFPALSSISVKAPCKTEHSPDKPWLTLAARTRTSVRATPLSARKASRLGPRGHVPVAG